MKTLYLMTIALIWVGSAVTGLLIWWILTGNGNVLQWGIWLLVALLVVGIPALISVCFLKFPRETT